MPDLWTWDAWDWIAAGICAAAVVMCVLIALAPLWPPDPPDR